VNGIELIYKIQRKILEKLAKNGDQVYQNKVHQTKEEYTQLINALKKVFNN
jgi:hypothetical protein